MTNPQFARILLSLWWEYRQESNNEPHTFENFIDWIDRSHSSRSGKRRRVANKTEQLADNPIEIPVQLGGAPTPPGTFYAGLNPFSGQIEFVADTIETFHRAQESGALAEAYRNLAKRLQAERNELYESPLGQVIEDAGVEIKDIRTAKEVIFPHNNSAKDALKQYALEDDD